MEMFSEAKSKIPPNLYFNYVFIAIAINFFYYLLKENLHEIHSESRETACALRETD